jgi:hypothetical protein
MTTTPLGDRDFAVLRNRDTTQWALHAFPEPHMPYSETIYFAPFPVDVERTLLEMAPAPLLRYFMDQLGDLPIIDIDVRGDANDLERFTPWSFRLRPVVRGEIRFGSRNGIDVPRTGMVRRAN